MYQYRSVEGEPSQELSEEELVRLARAGELTEETPVRRVPDGAWQPAWRQPALQGAFGLAEASAASPAPSTAAAPVAGPAPISLSPAPITSSNGSPRAPVWAFAVAAVVVVALVVAFVRGRGPSEVASRDGQMQLTLPPGWQVKAPGPDDELLAETDGGETVVLMGKIETEPDEPEMSLSAVDYNRMVEVIGKCKNFQDLGTRSYEANGLPFYRHDFRGVLEGQDGVFTLITTRTPDAYYRMVLSTVARRAADRQPMLDAVAMSVRRKGAPGKG